MTDDLPPYDASPENLLELCEALREGEMEREELLEEVDMQQTAFEQNVDYGIQLEFIEESGEALEATTRGQQYGYGSLPPEREMGLFQDAIREHSAYKEFIGIAQSEIQEVNDEPAILVDGLTRELRIAYGYEVKDRTLESVVATFLKTLDAAGLGDYTVGRRGYSTRLQVDGDMDDFAAELSGEEGESDEEEEEGAGEEEPSGDHEGSSPDESVEDDELEDGKEPGDSVDSSTPDLSSLVGSLDVDAGGVELNININISSADWGSEEVIKLVDAIREQSEG